MREHIPLIGSSSSSKDTIVPTRPLLHLLPTLANVVRAIHILEGDCLRRKIQVSNGWAQETRKVNYFFDDRLRNI